MELNEFCERVVDALEVIAANVAATPGLELISSEDLPSGGKPDLKSVPDEEPLTKKEKAAARRKELAAEKKAKADGEDTRGGVVKLEDIRLAFRKLAKDKGKEKAFAVLAELDVKSAKDIEPKNFGKALEFIERAGKTEDEDGEAW